jgi:hypothetical protein
MRGTNLIAVAFLSACALGQTGCARVFRDSKTAVRVESDPAGASVSIGDRVGPAPLEMVVPRSGLTEVRVTKNGFEENHGLVRKRMNGWWLTADLATCIVPVMLCIPILVDAISGAWYDVEPVYLARLAPLGLVGQPRPESIYVVRSEGAPSAPAASAPAAAPAVVAPPAPVDTISDSERKASARAAFQEGMELQAQKSYAEALGRFQFAQRLIDAPTHLLHIAQCLVATGKLVEAHEAYETLTRREVPKDAPQPFRDAADTGKKELTELRPRIPTLRIEVRPAPATMRNLVVLMNGRPVPIEIIGIARPVNPGAYRITATAWGIKAAPPTDVTLQESDAKEIDVKLGR